MRKELKLVWLYLFCLVGFFFFSLVISIKSYVLGVPVAFSLYVYALSPWALKTHRAILYAYRRVLIVTASSICVGVGVAASGKSPSAEAAFFALFFLCVTLFLLVFVVKIPDDSDNGDESA